MSELDPSEQVAEDLTTRKIEDVRQFAYREARRRFVSKESAEDIAQVAAAEYAVRFRAVRAIPAWVRTVVQNLVQRRNAARARREIAGTILAEPSVRPHDEIEERDLLDAILERLPARERVLLEMALAGRPQEEIGRTLGVPTSAVGAYLARAKERAGRVGAALAAPVSKDFSKRR